MLPVQVGVQVRSGRDSDHFRGSELPARCGESLYGRPANTHLTSSSFESGLRAGMVKECDHTTESSSHLSPHLRTGGGRLAWDAVTDRGSLFGFQRSGSSSEETPYQL